MLIHYPKKISERSKEPHTQQRGSTPSEMPKRPPHRKEGAKKKGQQIVAASQGPTTGKSMHVRKGPREIQNPTKPPLPDSRPHQRELSRG